MAFSERPGQAPVCSGDDYDEGQIVSIFFRKLQNLKKNSDRLARFPEQCRNTLWLLPRRAVGEEGGADGEITFQYDNHSEKSKRKISKKIGIMTYCAFQFSILSYFSRREGGADGEISTETSKNTFIFNTFDP